MQQLTLFKITLVLLLSWTFSLANADNLCDASCALTITFPDGGAIIADQEMTITFGDGALIDTAATQTAYVMGNTYSLNSGESLLFGANGSFDIGDSGNVDYTELTIQTNGEMTIAAHGGSESIYIRDDQTLNIEGNLTFIFNSSLVLGGELKGEGNATLNFQSSEGTISSQLLTGTDITLSSSTNSNLTINASNINTLSSDLSLSVQGVITINETQTIEAGEFIITSSEEEGGLGRIDFYFLLALALVSILIRKVKVFKLDTV